MIRLMLQLMLSLMCLDHQDIRFLGFSFVPHTMFYAHNVCPLFFT